MKIGRQLGENKMSPKAPQKNKNDKQVEKHGETEEIKDLKRQQMFSSN